ncbi:hypothetical protein [Bartonella doshiae]|uniref:TrbC/VIRB2 family n=2 Tax=Bartonella doshiae TaxID=33044 RepID=A0A380ZHK1_BARDO|nr:hypothetical protein [Bartonella doshiae]EJF80493.1 hypothetical protein MCS_01143 [Bartonella doshiae NCTC 12862 = ATCC 700133]SUV45792.1 Uncharacterised protein [Bartonella doshiae]
MITSIVMRIKNFKRPNILQTKSDHKISASFVTLITALATQSAFAKEKVNNVDVFIGIQYGLSMIVPIVGAVLFLLLFILCIFRIIARATFVRWAFSVIIASTAFYITHILFHIT